MAQVKFAAFADLHAEAMPDAKERLAAVIDAAQRAGVDFIVNLGDLGYPAGGTSLCAKARQPVNIRLADEGERPEPDVEYYIAMLNRAQMPCRHVLGNHDMDFSTKAQACQRLGMPAPNYSFVVNGYTFLVVDCCFFKNEGGYQDYDHSNYFGSDNLPYLPPRQIEWICESLEQAPGPVVLLSHQRLLAGPDAIQNAGELAAALQEVRRRGHPGPLLSLNGHNHMDDAVVENGTLYYDLNSISNQWLGEAFAAKRYPEKTEEQYPALRYFAPYRDPLYAIVTLCDDRVAIEGRQSAFVPPTPRALGCEAPFTANISSGEWTPRK